MYNKNGDNMKIAIVSDHRGYELKEYIKKNIDNLDIIDLGTYNNQMVDYPKYAFKLGEYVNKHNCFGVAICGSGIGMSIACNKVKGIRCARINTIKDASITRNDNDSNIVALPGSINKDKALKIINTFINKDFSKEERHIKRIDQINEYESNKRI